MAALREQGLNIFYGKWLINGFPRVLLIDVRSARPFFNRWKREFERNANVSIPSSDGIANDALQFGYLTVWFFREVRRKKSRPSFPIRIRFTTVLKRCT